MQKDIKHTRFAYVSDIIDLKKLEKETYNLFYIGLLLAICFHAILLTYYPHTKIVEKRGKNIKVELITQPHRMRKPFIITKKKSLEKFQYRKKTIAGKPSKRITMKSPSIIESLGEYNNLLSKEDFKTESGHDILPDSLLYQQKNSRMQKDLIPLKNAMLVDTGEYKSMIIVPPDNKMAIQGYTYIAIGCGKYLSPPDTLRKAIVNLEDVLNRYTNIYAIHEKYVNLDSPELFNYSFIYITIDKSFELTHKEAGNLGEYLATGGFVILDNGLPEYEINNIGESMKKMMRDAIGSVPLGCRTKHLSFSKVYSFKPVPKDHMIFHSFFDFYNGPPQGLFNRKQQYIEGIYFHWRLVGIYTPQGYGLSWYDRKNEEQMKIAVNILVYALLHQKAYIKVNCETEKLVWINTPLSPLRCW
jgi:hypothetical protein